MQVMLPRERRNMTGVELITRERQRQIEVEGWSYQHDDQHTQCQLAQAAACYAWPPMRPPFVKKAWPWDRVYWKPTPENRIRELIKAGALIAAEIDRLQRDKLRQR